MAGYKIMNHTFAEVTDASGKGEGVAAAAVVGGGAAAAVAVAVAVAVSPDFLDSLSMSTWTLYTLP